jgi:membrane-associated PAP2 superfamily phosphatase
MFDFDSGRFPWHDKWFATTLMHDGIKRLMVLCSLVPAVLLALHRLGSKRLRAGTRMRLQYVLVCAVAVPVTITQLKGWSVQACPWDLARYGGLAPHLSLFGPVPEGMVAGHCFPAGHASAALWLPAWAVFWLPQQPWRALWVAAAGFVTGMLLGWVQQLRGAHFLSHTLWSMWIAALLMLVLAHCFY